MSVIVECENCGSQVNIWREPVLQEDRDADQYGPAVHVILGDGWVLHRCNRNSDRVNRACEVVALQARCGLADALALMESTAQSSDVSLEVLAARVLDGSVRFDE